MCQIIIYQPAITRRKRSARVDRILAQTHTVFVYYLLDNASTDSTYEVNRICRKDHASFSSKRDKRVGNKIFDIIQDSRGEIISVSLTPTTNNAPDFLKKMLAFIEDNELI